MEKLIKKGIYSFLTGLIATMILQSSSAVIAIAISFVKAKKISFHQVTYLVVGANIGTTITNFIISIQVTAYAPFLTLIAAFFLLTGINRKNKIAFNILFSFSTIFVGLRLMETPLKMLVEYEPFNLFITSFSDRSFLTVVIGTLATMVIQSSSAMIGIIQSIYSADPSLNINTAIPLVIGANLGAMITIILISIGSSNEIKKTVLFHILFNIIGATFILIFLNLFTMLITLLTINITNVALIIAIIHLCFNLVTSLIVVPFIPWIVNLIDLKFPEKTIVFPFAN